MSMIWNKTNFLHYTQKEIDLKLRGKFNIMKNVNTCCFCGNEIPEGRDICPQCEKMFSEPLLHEPPAPEVNPKHDKLEICMVLLNTAMLLAILLKVVSL